MGELLYGSPAHRPISSAEIVEWAALYKLRNFEHEQAMKRKK